MMKLISKWYLHRIGWTINGEMPKDIKKCVIVAAPHTSNLDFIIGRAGFFVMNLNKVRFLIKKELFFFPLGAILKSLGGYPVDRKQNNVVKEMTSTFQKEDTFYLLVTPEGTRKLVKVWKKGFYHIALSANVPIILSYVDYAKKEGGIGPIIYPSGDYEKDFEIIKNFYKNISAKYPENFTFSSPKYHQN